MLYLTIKPRGSAIAFLILSLFLFTPVCIAKNADPSTDVPAMSLDELMEQLRLNNLQLKQAEQNYIAAKAIVPQVTAWNNPQVGLIENPIPGNPGNMNKSQGFSYTITQSFSFPGK
jgi:outer membrane protein TolC